MCVSDYIVVFVSVLLVLSGGVNMWYLWKYATCPVMMRYPTDELIYNFQQSGGSPAPSGSPASPAIKAKSIELPSTNV